MLTTVEKVIFLQRVPMFEGLSSRNLRVISDIAEEETFPRGQVIFEEGQSGDRMFIIVDGQVQVEKSTDAGGSLVLTTLEKRDLLGDMAILDDEPRSASARTVTDSRLLGVGSAQMKDLIREYPEIAFGLLKFCAMRIRETNKRMQMMSVVPGQARAAAASRLTVLTGPDTGKVFTITTPVVKLGRSGGEDIEALDRFAVRDAAKQVSRNHAELAGEGGKFKVNDLGSVNGTFVNGTRVDKPTALKSGDVIHLGTEFSMRFDA